MQLPGVQGVPLRPRPVRGPPSRGQGVVVARIRSIKPESATSLDLAGVSIPCRWHFAILWTYADDDGRGVDEPRLLKAAIWPLDDEITLESIEGFQAELERAGLIERYEHDARPYFAVVNFAKHQHPQKPTPSKLPGPQEGSPRENGTLREESHTAPVGLSPVEEGRVEERRGSSAPAAPSPGRDGLWTAVLLACNVNGDELTERTRKKHGDAVKLIREAGGTAEQVPFRAAVYLERFSTAALTPHALANHWAECDPKLQRNGNGQGLRSEPALRRALARGGSRDS